MRGKIVSISLLLLLTSILTWCMLPVVRGPPIIVDGNPTDWIGTAPINNNTGTISEYEYIWVDEMEDDTGNGTYTYPTVIQAGTRVFTGGDADLKELRITRDADYVYFLLKFDNITDRGWVAGGQAETTAVAICIDTDRKYGSGFYWVEEEIGWGIWSNIELPPEAWWEYLIEIALQDVVLWYWNGTSYTTTEITRNFPLAVDTTVYETIEFAVPIGAAGLPDPTGQTWRFSAFVGLQDYEHFREVWSTEYAAIDPWAPGGGTDHWLDPNAFDAAFFATKAEQEDAFNGFTNETFAVVSAYTDIDMNLISPPPPEHDLSVSAMQAPSFLEPSDSSIITAKVGNRGSNDESSVEVQFLVNGSLEKSTTIPLLMSMSSEEVNFSWTAPETAGIYNLTIYAVPVSGENITYNNYVSRLVEVRYFMHPAEWMKHAIFYQIYPDRFRDGNPNNNAWGDGTSGDILWKNPGDWPSTVYAANRTWGEYPYLDAPYGRDWFGGDLQGVAEKASYLADLGITAIWFNPTMDSTDNHGYTVIDYKSVNRYFGMNHRDAEGTLILDYNTSLEVFKNMTAALDKYGIRVILDGVFNHVSAKNQWFDRDNDFPTDGAYESKTSQWYDWFVFYNWPDDYKCWWGVENMPEPEEVAGFKDYIYRADDSVIKFWNNLGVDGWRLDCGPDVSDEFWREFRTYYKEINPEGFILGEAWGDSSRWLQGDQWDSTMNYPFRSAVLNWANGGSVSSFASSLNNIRSWYSEEVFYTLFNILDSHDVPRALSELGEDKTRMKLAVIFQMTYPGVPVVYYGDEVGMSGPGWFEHARQCYPWPDTGGSPDVDMFNHCKKLIEIRNSHPVLRVGTLETRLVDDAKNIYVLARRHGSTAAILVYNSGGTAQTVNVNVGDLVDEGTILTDVLNNETYIVSGGMITVQTKGMWANIILSPSAVSCDSTGSPKDIFYPEDHIYVKGAGFPADKTVRIYVTLNTTWTDGAPITDVRIHGPDTTTTDSNGFLPVTHLVSARDLPAEWPANYDIVIDVDCDGFFDVGLDAVDDVTTLPGVTIVPEIIFMRDLAILFTIWLTATITRRRHRIRRFK